MAKFCLIRKSSIGFVVQYTQEKLTKRIELSCHMNLRGLTGPLFCLESNIFLISECDGVFMWLETVENGFINTEHIVRIDLDTKDIEDYRSVSISAYTVTGEEFDVFSVGSYEFYFTENCMEAIQKNPWAFMESIRKKYLIRLLPANKY